MKYILDNTQSFRVAHALQALDDRRKIIHLTDRFPADTKDPVWLPELIAEGHWTVITENIHQENEHERKLWLQSGLTVFFLAKGWRTMLAWDKAVKLIALWPKITQTAETIAPGQLYLVRTSSPVLEPFK